MGEFLEAARGRCAAADDERRGFLVLEAVRKRVANARGRSDRRLFTGFEFEFH